MEGNISITYLFSSEIYLGPLKCQMMLLMSGAFIRLVSLQRFDLIYMLLLFLLPLFCLYLYCFWLVNPFMPNVP